MKRLALSVLTVVALSACGGNDSFRASSNSAALSAIPAAGSFSGMTVFAKDVAEEAPPVADEAGDTHLYLCIKNPFDKEAKELHLTLIAQTKDGLVSASVQAEKSDEGPKNPKIVSIHLAVKEEHVDDTGRKITAYKTAINAQLIATSESPADAKYIHPGALIVPVDGKGVASPTLCIDVVEAKKSDSK